MDKWTKIPATEEAVKSLNRTALLSQEQRRSTVERGVVSLREPPTIACGCSRPGQFSQ